MIVFLFKVVIVLSFSILRLFITLSAVVFLIFDENKLVLLSECIIDLSLECLLLLKLGISLGGGSFLLGFGLLNLSFLFGGLQLLF